MDIESNMSDEGKEKAKSEAAAEDGEARSCKKSKMTHFACILEGAHLCPPPHLFSSPLLLLLSVTHQGDCGTCCDSFLPSLSLSLFSEKGDTFAPFPF